ncbi:hypothetical protein, partial [Methanothrix soehngenii]|uniref:hypothetical protein n=1 Tax=Methanothrix soehngenii TaxID=2223 RepID=UPI002FE00660
LRFLVDLFFQLMNKSELDELVIRENISILLQGGQFCAQGGVFFLQTGYSILQRRNAILQRLEGLLDCLDYEILELSIGQGDELL